RRLAILSAASVGLTSGLARAADGTWSGTTGGSWGDSANWIAGSIPNATSDTAFFSTNGASQTITLDALRSIKALQFNASASGALTFNTGSGGAGTRFTLNTASAGATTIFVDALSGDHTINAEVRLGGQDDEAFLINGSRTFTIGGILSGTSATRGFTKTG